MKRLSIWLISAAVLLAVVALWVHQSNNKQPDLSFKKAKIERSALITEPDQTLSLVEQIASDLKERYAESINQIVTQAFLLSELDRLNRLYPTQGRELFELAVALAFPNQFSQIISLINRLIEYEQWEEQNSTRLNRMNEVERLAALWEKRYELFGQDAELLWSNSAFGQDEKQIQIQDEMQRLSQISDQPVSAIAAELMGAVDEVYGTSIAGLALTPNDIGQAVFALDSIQGSLADMSPQQRQREIANLRRQVGYTEEQIQILANKDQINQQKWNAGNEYMSARTELSTQLKGDQLDQAIEELQSRVFGRSAATIAAEEDSGFYRFNRPRMYGVN